MWPGVRITQRAGVVAARLCIESRELTAAVDTLGEITMIAVAERPTTAMTTVHLQSTTGEDACALAFGYLRWASAWNRIAT